MRSLLLVVIYLVLLTGGVPVLLGCVLFGLRDAFIAYGRWMMRVGRDVLGISVDVSGGGRLVRNTPYVFMANHASFLDGPLLMTVLDRPVRAIVKRFVFRVPVLGLGMRFVGYVPLDKEGAGVGRDRIALAARHVREKGYSFLIFPEGTRSFDGRLLPFRRGGFFLALETGAPIVPVSIQGSHELMPRGRWLVRKGAVRVVFHDPVPVKGFTPETLPELMDKVRAAIAPG